MASSKSVKFTESAARKVANVVRYVEGLAGNNLPTKGGKGNRQPPQGMFAVLCTVDGGTVGSPSTTCDLTYTVNSFTGFEYATLATPIAVCRIANMTYISPAAGSIGYATFDEDGVFTLLQVPCEQLDIEECA